MLIVFAHDGDNAFGGVNNYFLNYRNKLFRDIPIIFNVLVLL